MVSFWLNYSPYCHFLLDLLHSAAHQCLELIVCDVLRMWMSWLYQNESQKHVIWSMSSEACRLKHVVWSMSSSRWLQAFLVLSQTHQSVWWPGRLLAVNTPASSSSSSKDRFRPKRWDEANLPHFGLLNLPHFGFHVKTWGQHQNDELN